VNYFIYSNIQIIPHIELCSNLLYYRYMTVENLTQQDKKTLEHKDRYDEHLPHTSVRDSIHFHKKTEDFRDTIAYHIAIVLETVAAVPGMVGGLIHHLVSLRLIKDDHGWIKTLLHEAENERMHLMVYSHIYKPTYFERSLIAVVQFFFFFFYITLYIISQKTAHRVVGYFEEQAIHSYSTFLSLIDDGSIKNVSAPAMAIEYWGLTEDATLRDVVLATRADEVEHRDVNHNFADKLSHKK
jgi:ubiquinol oxidase